ncbi:MAG: substrate-binding domain-containing protein [Verrucomicrobia bacterium]|nr:substrate-binding domain-containing protein [Verrucomicrobiota bacterium]
MSSTVTLPCKPSRVLAWNTVAVALRRGIKGGIYKTDAMIPSELELCRRFKVSRVTIRAALQLLVRDGLLVKQQGRGTFVREPKSRRQTRLGFLVAGEDLLNPIYAAVLRGAENAAVEHEAVLHYQRIPIFPRGAPRTQSASSEARLIRRMVDEDHVDGFMVIGWIDAPLIEMIRSFRLPLVILGSHQLSDETAARLQSRGRNGWDQVDVDDAAVGRIVGKYLADLGHQCVATPAVQPPLKTTECMLAGLREVLPERSVAILPCLSTGDVQAEDIEKAVLRAFRMTPRARWPTAIICADAEALAVMRAARTLGLAVPQDLSIVGLGDLRLNTNYDPPLTSVRLFPEEIGRRGFRILMSRVEDAVPSANPAPSLVQPELVIRLSTGKPAGRPAHIVTSPLKPNSVTLQKS